MVPGTGSAADDQNAGRIGNSGFIVGERGVIAVDTGTSYAHGRDLLAAIREVTAQPVRVALITHTRPEFLFGGATFREAGIPIRMHRRTAGLMASRCETCLRTLRQTLGESAMHGTTLYKADQEFDATHELDLIGRPGYVAELRRDVTRVVERLAWIQLCDTPALTWRLRTEVERLRADLDQTARELTASHDRRAEAQARLDAVLASAAWRVTGPLRAASRAIRWRGR